jgi:hypothetical protein
MVMKIRLKNITALDKYIYQTALALEQPFSPSELLSAIQTEHPAWDIRIIRYRCQKYQRQKMLKRTGCFRSVRYSCLLSEQDMENADYTFSHVKDANTGTFSCGL